MKYYKDSNGEVFAYDENQTPKEGLIKMSALEVQEHLKSIEPTYADKRSAEYPPIGDQLDALLKEFQQHVSSGGTISPALQSIVDAWQAVKDKYPKPE